MALRTKKRRLFAFIKVVSVILITSAIGLELWNTYALLTNSQIPSSLNPVILIERFAMTVHFVEGVIAAYKAPSKKKIPIKYGAYTFFVGTVGLLELFESEV
ncbi:MAG TPA: hypothetical protein V6D50_17265 [Chroococcales cyanobacterium]|jgi:hypothetical protein